MDNDKTAKKSWRHQPNVDVQFVSLISIDDQRQFFYNYSPTSANGRPLQHFVSLSPTERRAPRRNSRGKNFERIEVRRRVRAAMKFMFSHFVSTQNLFIFSAEAASCERKWRETFGFECDPFGCPNRLLCKNGRWGLIEAVNHAMCIGAQ